MIIESQFHTGSQLPLKITLRGFFSSCRDDLQRTMKNSIQTKLEKLYKEKILILQFTSVKFFKKSNYISLLCSEEQVFKRQRIR